MAACRQELAGHCTELHRRNAAGIATLEAHLRRYGYSGDFRPHVVPVTCCEPENRPPAPQSATVTEPRGVAGGKTPAVAQHSSVEAQQHTQRLDHWRSDSAASGQHSGVSGSQLRDAARPLGMLDNVLSQRPSTAPVDGMALTADVDADTSGVLCKHGAVVFVHVRCDRNLPYTRRQFK